MSAAKSNKQSPQVGQSVSLKSDSSNFDRTGYNVPANVSGPLQQKNVLSSVLQKTAEHVQKSAISADNVQMRTRGTSTRERTNRGRGLDWDAHHTGLGPESSGTEQPSFRQSAGGSLDEMISNEITSVNGEAASFTNAGEVEQRITELRESGNEEAASTLEQQLRVIEQHSIVDVLDPENSARYSPGSSTYCNYYARDYLDAQGITLPGGNANNLNAWLGRQSARHNRTNGRRGEWREVSMEEAQSLANQGRHVVISAESPGSHGHISVVLGERGGHDSQQTGEGVVPLQSQAGSAAHLENRGTRNGERWWEDSSHQSGHAYVYEGDISEERLYNQDDQQDETEEADTE